jgi:hypothetical protein
MADRVRKVSYCYVTTPNRAGHGAKVMAELTKAGVNLLAFSGFPAKDRKSQLDLVTDKTAALRRLAKRHGWKLSKTKRAFLIQGQDRAGAAYGHHEKLAREGINVTAADAVCAGKGRYGMILWVRPKDYSRAAKVLRAK